jgi:hypothetical protein
MRKPTHASGENPGAKRLLRSSLDGPAGADWPAGPLPSVPRAATAADPGGCDEILRFLVKIRDEPLIKLQIGVNPPRGFD